MIAITILLIFLAVMNVGLILFLVYDSYGTQMAFDEIRKDAAALQAEHDKLREIEERLHLEKRKKEAHHDE